MWILRMAGFPFRQSWFSFSLYVTVSVGMVFSGSAANAGNWFNWCKWAKLVRRTRPAIGRAEFQQRAESFIKAIRENPHNYEVRQVFHDWLIDHDQQVLADWLRDWNALAPVEGSPARGPLIARQNQLLVNLASGKIDNNATLSAIVDELLKGPIAPDMNGFLLADLIRIQHEREKHPKKSPQMAALIAREKKILDKFTLDLPNGSLEDLQKILTRAPQIRQVRISDPAAYPLVPLRDLTEMQKVITPKADGSAEENFNVTKRSFALSGTFRIQPRDGGKSLVTLAVTETNPWVARTPTPIPSAIFGVYSADGSLIGLGSTDTGILVPKLRPGERYTIRLVGR